MVPISPKARDDPTRYRSDTGFVPKVGGDPLPTFADQRQRAALAAVEDVAPGLHREPGTHRPRRGMAAWSIEAARDRDLRGWSYVEIAKCLDYTDERFARALAFWFRDATLQCLSDAFRGVELANSDEGRGRADADSSGAMAVSATSWAAAQLALQAALRPAAQDRRDAA